MFIVILIFVRVMGRVTRPAKPIHSERLRIIFMMGLGVGCATLFTRLLNKLPGLYGHLNDSMCLHFVWIS